MANSPIFSSTSYLSDSAMMSECSLAEGDKQVQGIGIS